MAPRVFTYDETRINYFVTDTFGDITVSETSSEDFGNITDAHIIEEDELGFNPSDYGLVVWVGDILPFGSMGTIQNTLEESVAFVPAVPQQPVLIQGQGKVSRSQAPWQGSGTLFEIGGGLERLVVPDLGAAGPEPTLNGEAATRQTFTEVGSGSLTVSDEAQTAEFNIYPFVSRITLTVSGGTSQEYPDEYIEAHPNEEVLNGTGDESRTYDYSIFTGTFEEQDFGSISVKQGANFSEANTTFDSTNSSINSFADADIVESVDYGLLSVTEITEIVTRIITTSDFAAYNPTYIGTFLAQSGTGIGQGGGFNIGEHIKFGSITNGRSFEWDVDTTNATSITIRAIRGNDANGGEDPDTSSESLVLDRWNGTSWVRINTVIAYNDNSFDTLRDITIPLDAVHRGQYTYRIYQAVSSGPTWDHYGVTQISYEVEQTVPIPSDDWGEIVADQRYGKITTKATYSGALTRAFERFEPRYIGETATLSLRDGLLPDEERKVFAFEGSGTITAVGQLGLGQAPQHTVFGEEGQFTFGGSGAEAFVPRGIESFGLVLTGGAGTEKITFQGDEERAEFFFTGFSEGLKLTHYPPSQTATLSISGAASDIAQISDYVGFRLFTFTGGIIEDFTPHWRSPLERDGFVEPLDFGFISEAPAPPPEGYEDWGLVRLVAFRADDFGYIIDLFRKVQIYGDVQDSFSRATYQGVGTFFMSEPAVEAVVFDYETSGITGIATYKAGINIFGANWFSQAPQHTVFGLEGKFTIGGAGAESITPTTEIGSGSLFTIGGIAESSAVTPPAAGVKFISGAADVKQSPAPSASGLITLRQGREEGQTYLRIIDVGETAGLFGFAGGATGEKQTDSYNESSIWYGQENEDFGLLSGTPTFGFDLAQIPSLPTFDGTSSAENFSTTNASIDWGDIGNGEGSNTIGGPDYDQYLYPSNTGFVNQSIDNGYEDYGWVNEEDSQPTRFPLSVGVALSFTEGALVTRFIPSFPGSGSALFTISSALESITVFERADVPLLPLSGSAEEAYSAQTPERTVTILIDGQSTESITITANQFVGVGIGTLFSFGELVERVRFEEVGIGSATFTGTGVEKFISNPPEGTQLFTPYGSYSDLSATFSEVATKATLRLSGELVHPFIDYTPHYGIERNIGIETGFTLFAGGAGGEYGDPGIVTTRFIPKYPASGVIGISSRAISRTNAPIITDGTIYILGIHTAAQGVSSGRETGAGERFIPASIDAGPGLFLFKGDAPNRPIQVYGYYGDDKDPGTSGQITISTETTPTLYREITTAAVGIGIGTFSGYITERKSKAYSGSGSLFKTGGSAESIPVRPVTSGTIFVSGAYGAEYAYSAQTPENVITLTLSGVADKAVLLTTDFGGTIFASGVAGESATFDEIGSGSLFAIGGGAESVTPVVSTFTVLVNVGGSADSREIAVYGYYGDDRDPGTSGTISIVGELTHPNIDFTPAVTGVGLFKIDGTAIPKFQLTADVLGGKATISGSAEVSFTSGAGEQTMLFRVLGNADTALNQVFGYYGDDKDPGTSGTLTISGIGETREVQVYGYYGDDRDPGTSGKITLSSTTLVFPFVDYTPSPDGSGLFIIGGSADKRRVFPPVDGRGVLFKIGTAQEAYTRATYVGIGNVRYSSTTIASTQLVQFEEGRVYVIII